MRVTLRRVLLFRAPGAALTTVALVARALAEGAERAAERVRSGALHELERGKPKRPRKQPDQPGSPNTPAPRSGTILAGR